MPGRIYSTEGVRITRCSEGVTGFNEKYQQITLEVDQELHRLIEVLVPPGAYLELLTFGSDGEKALAFEGTQAGVKMNGKEYVNNPGGAWRGVFWGGVPVKS